MQLPLKFFFLACFALAGVVCDWSKWTVAELTALNNQAELHKCFPPNTLPLQRYISITDEKERKELLVNRAKNLMEKFGKNILFTFEGTDPANVTAQGISRAAFLVAAKQQLGYLDTEIASDSFHSMLEFGPLLDEALKAAFDVSGQVRINKQFAKEEQEKPPKPPGLLETLLFGNAKTVWRIIPAAVDPSPDVFVVNTAFRVDGLVMQKEKDDFTAAKSIDIADRDLLAWLEGKLGDNVPFTFSGAAVQDVDDYKKRDDASKAFRNNALKIFGYDPKDVDYAAKIRQHGGAGGLLRLNQLIQAAFDKGGIKRIRAALPKPSSGTVTSPVPVADPTDELSTLFAALTNNSPSF